MRPVPFSVCSLLYSGIELDCQKHNALATRPCAPCPTPFPRENCSHGGLLCCQALACPAGMERPREDSGCTVCRGRIQCFSHHHLLT